MDHESKLFDLLQDCSTLTPRQTVEKLNQQEGLITSIIGTLSDQYKRQAGHPIYSTLFELYRSKVKEAKCFVLQFLPSLIWIYLSAKSRRDKQGYGKLEAILLAIYNAEVHESKTPKTFRLPSLSRPSLYHESSVDMMAQSALTESALSRHELAETPISGPTKEITTVTASNRMSVLCVALRQYNNFIAFMDKASHASFWLMAIRVSAAGFSKLCTPESTASQLADAISNEELSRLASHPRIPLSAEYIQELIHSLYFLMYNGCPVQATRAIESLHFRASHSLLAPANVLSNAIMHSLSSTNGMPHDGPLGLDVHLSKLPARHASPDSERPLVAMTSKGMVTVSSIQYYNLEDSVTDDDQSFQTHKKSNSLDFWKNSPPHRSTKPNIELKEMSTNGQYVKRVARKSFSEDNIAITRQNDDVYTTKL